MVDLDESYLTEYSVCKTEEFSLATDKLAGVNLLITHLAFAALRCGIREGAFSFSAGEVRFFAEFFSADAPLKKLGAAVIFYGYRSYLATEAGDARLKGLTEFRVEKAVSPALSYGKLYRTFSAEVNLPLLNEEQRRIVETEGKNLLVQGIAGSGKTNLCIDKILFAAASGYMGKTLYSTYSRGLLLDVRRKIEDYASSLREFLKLYEEGRTHTTDPSETHAVSRMIGVPLSTAEPIESQLRRILDYLSEKVEYLLPEDLYRRELGDRPIADEDFFRSFLQEIRNYNLAARLKKCDLRREVLYKEIYGFLFGKATEGDLTKEEYLSLRKGAFTRQEGELIYDLSVAYREKIVEGRRMDLNLACRELTPRAYPEYSLVVLDEVQDFTEVQLAFFRSIGIKLFCVGDASQMVNPAYFSFARLKDMLYRKDVTDVAELTYNYRNSREIASVVAALSDINRKTFGVHGFVLTAEAVSSEEGAFAVTFPTEDFAERMKKEAIDNFTVVVASGEEKERLRALLPQKEILTVSEIKGLERDTVVLYNVISSNKEKFDRLQRTEINRKTADENSLYRYYFNLFYVGVSRARRHLFVAESEGVSLFESFFRENFQSLTVESAVKKLKETVGSTLVEQAEHKRRANEFTRLGQYDNALHAASLLVNDQERARAYADVEIWREYVSRGDYVGAGIAYWEKGYNQDAREYFELGGEKDLSDLLDAASGGTDEKLDYNILRHYDRLKGNPAAMKIIVALLGKDSAALKEETRDIARKIKGLNQKRS